MIKVEYDDDADAVYIELSDGLVARTVAIDPGTMVDVDEAGAPVGIEVIHPARRWPFGEVATRFALSSDVVEQIQTLFFPEANSPFPFTGRRRSTLV